MDPHQWIQMYFPYIMKKNSIKQLLLHGTDILINKLLTDYFTYVYTVRVYDEKC